MRPFLRCCLLFLPVIGGVLPAQDTAALTVTACDPGNAVVAGVRIRLLDLQKGTVLQAETSASGFAAFDSLPAGVYTLEASKAGFDTIRVPRLTLAVRDRLALTLSLRVSPAQRTPGPVNSPVGSVTTDPSLGFSAGHDYFQHLPVNGRNAETVLLMTPGLMSAANGEFSTAGLRTGTNDYSVDGARFDTDPRAGAGASTALISAAAAGEFRVQTVSVAPEFGRSPGAQVDISTRYGGNALHGSLFYYFRNDRMDANDWFANASGDPRGKLRQNHPGFALGGPVVRNKTFFFVSEDSLRLVAPLTVSATVPDLATRLAAPTALRPYLNAFPIPNGQSLSGGAAQFQAVAAEPATWDSGSLRLDHVLNNRMTAFARYTLAAADSQSRGAGDTSPNVLTSRNSRSHVAAAGWTAAAPAGLVNDLRVGYSRLRWDSSSVMDSFGGAAPLTDAQIFPKGISSTSGEFRLNLLGAASYAYGAGSGLEQQQIYLADGLAKSVEGHSYRVGLEYHRVLPVIHRPPYIQSLTFNGLSGGNAALVSGIAVNARVSSNFTSVYPVYSSFSAYAQDTFRASERTTLLYGFRWNVDPAPSARQGPKPFAVSSSNVAGVTQIEPVYPTHWFEVAPRLALSYQMDTTPGREMMFRIGAGAFYDNSYGHLIGAFNGAPYSSIVTITEAAFPLAGSDAAPPALPPGRPFGQVYTAEMGLKSPVVFEWSTSIERNFGLGQTLSVGYVGARGRRLLRVETQPSFTNAYGLLSVAENKVTSKYDGVQIQFRRRFRANMQTQVSYTYGHATDTGATEPAATGGLAALFDNERGPSDYDLRHNLSFSGTLRLSGTRRRGLGILFHNWYAEWMASARSALPFDVQTITALTSNAGSSSDITTNLRDQVFGLARPNSTGETVWLFDRTVPGRRRLNPAAFAAPSDYAQGGVQRNGFRGLGATQVDLGLRRELAVSEQYRLHVSLHAFNVFNHPNFANPLSWEGANLASPNLGVMTRMLNQSSAGGINPLYQPGGPRSIEVALRLQF